MGEPDWYPGKILDPWGYAQQQSGQQDWQQAIVQAQGQAQQLHSLAEIQKQANVFGVQYLTPVEQAILELDKEFPGIIVTWPRYIEPWWLRLLRFLVRIL